MTNWPATHGSSAASPARSSPRASRIPRRRKRPFRASPGSREEKQRQYLAAILSEKKVTLSIGNRILGALLASFGGSYRFFHRRHQLPTRHLNIPRPLRQHFGSKLKFASTIGMLPEEVGESIGIFHAFRNEVYHIGIQHEAVLPAVAAFYFKVACEFLAGYTPRWIGYNPDIELPERARKFFGNERFHINGIEKYQAACGELEDMLPFSPADLARILADHMDDLIKMQDTAIRMIATAGPRKHSRDEAVAETFAWSVAFTELES
jgi:hypothetical protein